MQVLIAEGLIDEPFVRDRTENFEALRDLVRDYPPERTAPVCGIDAGTIRAVARAIGTARALMIFWGMGISQHTHGTDNARCLIALCLLTGNVGLPGTGLHPLRGQNNVQGASDAGLIPMFLPDYQPVGRVDLRGKFEELWEQSLDPVRGLTVVEIMNAIHAGEITGMYIEGENPAMSDPDLQHARGALAKLDHLVVQDLFVTETAFHADVILPVSAFAEKSGTFTNNEGRTQALRKFREPAFDARSNLAIFDFIAALREQPLQPSTETAIFDEMTRLVPAYDGLTREGLGADGAFTTSAPQPWASGFFAPPSAPGVTDVLQLITGNCLFHNGYLSERSEILNTVANDPYVALSAENAAQLGLADGDQVVVRSPRGALTAQLKVERAFPTGLVFVPENYRSLRLNSLMRRGEYPCPVEVQKAQTEREIDGKARIWRGA